jgi:hypothetical protein
VRLARKPLVSKLIWEGKMKSLLSLDTGLRNSFTDCGGQCGKADLILSFCFNQNILVFPFVFRAI